MDVKAQEAPRPRFIIGSGILLSTIDENITKLNGAALYIDLPLVYIKSNPISLKTFSSINIFPYEESYNLAVSYKKYWKNRNVDDYEPYRGLFTSIGVSVENGLIKGHPIGQRGSLWTTYIYKEANYYFEPGIIMEIGWDFDYLTLIIPMNINSKRTNIGFVVGIRFIK